MLDRGRRRELCARSSRAPSSAIRPGASSPRTISALALRALESGSTIGSIGAAAGARPRGKSLAILPFVNAGVDPALEYLTDGITESIINSLSQLDGLRIVPRSLVFRYKGLQADPATVGLALNARTILTGRVVQQGDVLNIQAELVDTTTESQLWGEQFRQKVADLVTVQEEIAWQISEALRLKLTGAQKTRLRRRHTASAAASQEYLRGRFEWNRWTAEGFRRAIEHFEQAIAHDPKYAPAYAGHLRQLHRHGLLRLRAGRRRLPARPGRGREGARDRSRRSPTPTRRSRCRACSGSSTGRRPSASSARRCS